MDEKPVDAVPGPEPKERSFWRSGRGVAVVVTLVVLSLLAGIPYYDLYRKRHQFPEPTVLEGPGLRFTAGTCSAQEPGIEGVKSSAWRENEGLEISATMIENCAAKIKDGGYSREGSTIFLSYKIEAANPPARCNCAYRLQYVISGIPRAEYSIKFPTTGLRPETGLAPK